MAATLDSLATEAMNLPKDQRLTLAHWLLASLESETEAGAEAAWDAEIQQRIQDYDAGRTKGIPGSQVFDELDRKLKR